MSEAAIQEEQQVQQEPHGTEQQPSIDWKAEARKWESRSKENAEKLKGIETERETDTKRLEELEERATKAEQEAESLRKQKELAEIRSAIGSEYGIPTDIVSILAGGNEEELKASAEKLRGWVPTAPVVNDSGKPTGEKLAASDKTKFVKDLFNN